MKKMVIILLVGFVVFTLENQLQIVEVERNDEMDGITEKIEKLSKYEPFLRNAAQYGVKELNEKQKEEGKEYQLQEVLTEGAKMNFGLEKEICYLVSDGANQFEYRRKWAEFKLEETRYLIDKKPIFEQIVPQNKQEESPTEISTVDDITGAKNTLTLQGPLEMNLERANSPQFNLPKTLETNGKISKVRLEEGSVVEVQGISSLRLSSPLSIKMDTHSLPLKISVQGEPKVEAHLPRGRKQFKISSQEKLKLKVDKSSSTAVVQLPPHKQHNHPAVSGNKLFTNNILEHFLEALQRVANAEGVNVKTLSFKEIKEASIKFVHLISIPVLLREKRSSRVSQFQITIAVDFDYNLSLFGVEEMEPRAESSITLPPTFNQTIVEELQNLILNTNQKHNLG